MRPDERTPAHVVKMREARRKGWEKRHAAMADHAHTIVAEISKNWIEGVGVEVPGLPSLLSQRFELVIAANAKRAYRLRDWKLSRLSGPNAKGQSVINETIVAVFERRVARRSAVTS